MVDNLDCDILAGVPFCKDNDVTVFLARDEISIGKTIIPYGAKCKPKIHEIFRADSFILRNDTRKVAMPDEFLEIESESLDGYEGEISIEPHIDSPAEWPTPAISRVIQGRVRVPNITGEPIKLSRSQHFALIRRVTIPADSPAHFQEVSCW